MKQACWHRNVITLAGWMGPGSMGNGLAITAEYVHTFFDVYLKDAPAALLRTCCITQF